jgi:hypothetical protein
MQDNLRLAREHLERTKVWLNYVDNYGGNRYFFNQAMDDFNVAKAQLDDVEYSLLPLGTHLLPGDFTAFLADWNAEMTDTCGGWEGANRRRFKERFPEKWKMYTLKKKEFLRIYPVQVENVKRYQAEHPEERDDYSEPYYIPLPVSPPPEEEQQQQQQQQQEANTFIPTLDIPASTRPPFFEPEASPKSPKPSKPRNPYYNHHRWPSPRAKVIVGIYKKNFYSFTAEWLRLHGSNVIMTHETCLHFLSHKMGVSLTEFMEIPPAEVLRRLFDKKPYLSTMIFPLLGRYPYSWER